MRACMLIAILSAHTVNSGTVIQCERWLRSTAAGRQHLRCWSCWVRVHASPSSLSYITTAGMLLSLQAYDVLLVWSFSMNWYTTCLCHTHTVHSHCSPVVYMLCVDILLHIMPSGIVLPVTWSVLLSLLLLGAVRYISSQLSMTQHVCAYITMCIYHTRYGICTAIDVNAIIRHTLCSVSISALLSSITWQHTSIL